MEHGITLNENTNETFTRVSGRDVEYKRFKVEVEKVSALITNSEINSPSLVKIDVKNHEPEVLEGFESYLNHEIAFLIEVLSEENAIRLNRIFSNFNLEFYHIDDLKGTVRRTGVIVQSDFYNYFICELPVARKMKSLITLE